MTYKGIKLNEMIIGHIMPYVYDFNFECAIGNSFTHMPEVVIE